jgi:hypothetical protein
MMKASTQSKTKTNGGRRHFTYRGEDRTAEDVSRASKTSGGTFDQYLTQGVNFFKPREGENNIRIMPLSWEDTKKWGKDWAILIYVHHSIGADNSAYLCLEKMKGEACPICEARADAETEEEQRALRPNKRALVWLIDRDNEKAGPHVWSMPLQLYRDLQTRSIDKKTGTVILIDHPDEGYDISFVKEGTGLHTKYTAVEVARDGSALSENEKKQTRWLDLIAEQPLPEILNYYDADYITKVLEGKSSKRDDDEDEDDDDKPARKRVKLENRRNKGKADDDDDEAEETEDEDEDEADEKAIRRNKRSVARDEDDDDGEAEEESEDSDDEDEEDAKPTRRRTSKVVDDDDGDEETEESDDDDDDEPKAKKGKGKPSKRRAVAADDDDDDGDDEEADDDSDDEDEEDSPPKSKAGSASARARAKLEALKKKRRK